MKKLFLTLTLVLFVIPFGMSQDLPSNIPANGLVGYYPFNGNANDESGNGYHGTVYGAALTADRIGNENSSYSFDGVDDYISGTMQGINQLNESTVSTWIKYTGDEGGTPYDLFFQYGTYGNHTLAYGYNYSEKKLDLYSNCFEFTRYTSVDLNDDWINLVITDDNSITKIYVNGNLVEFFDAEILNNSCFQGSYEFYIGGGSDNQYVTGNIDEFILWNRALTEQEIQGLYTSSNGDILLNGVVSAENNQIKNVADPTDAQDVVTKNYTYSKVEVDALINEIRTELGNQIDNDNDGYTEGMGDCDDSDSEINPTANEVCDNIDNNCNAEIDEGVTNPYYQDVDGDGFGLNGIEPVMTCSPSEGYVSNNQDCDDSNSAVYPGAPELSDGIDNDCDGQIDEQNEQTLVSGHEDSSTFPSEHSPDYSTVISHVNDVSQLLTPNTKITKLIIHPNESKNNVKVIPFLTDENFNVVALGEEYYFDAIEGELHEIILNTELTSTSSFYIGCYENVITKHKPSSCNGKYKWGIGEPAIGITINDGTSNSSNCRSTQAYGY